MASDNKGKTSQIHLRVDAEQKAQVQEILALCGTNLNSVIELLFQNIINYRGVPFDIRVPDNIPIKSLGEKGGKKNGDRKRGIVKAIDEKEKMLTDSVSDNVGHVQRQLSGKTEDPYREPAPVDFSVSVQEIKILEDESLDNVEGTEGGTIFVEEKEQESGNECQDSIGLGSLFSDMLTWGEKGEEHSKEDSEDSFKQSEEITDKEILQNIDNEPTIEIDVSLWNEAFVEKEESINSATKTSLEDELNLMDSFLKNL